VNQECQRFWTYAETTTSILQEFSTPCNSGCGVYAHQKIYAEANFATLATGRQRIENVTEKDLSQKPQNIKIRIQSENVLLNCERSSSHYR
jgi:hypothetical protein